MSRVNPLWTAQLNNWCMCQCIKRMMKRKASYSATVWGIRTSTPHSGVQWTIIEHKLPKHSTEILHICTGRKGVVTSPWTKIGVVKLFRLELPPLFFQKSIIFPSKLPQKPQHKVRSQKQITGLFGNFSQVADPSPPSPPFGNPSFEKKMLSFILHFRPLGTFLVFTKKLKFCHFCYIYFWE